MKKNRHQVITKDGSPTLFVPELDEHYHSVHGALQESKHVFIQAGLHELQKKGFRNINIFEMGFGTGINAWLSQKFATDNKLKIRYECIEAYPLDIEEAQCIAEGLIADQSEQKAFIELHRAAWGKTSVINENYTLLKRAEKLQDYAIGEKAELIYFDAFAPSAQPDLWEAFVFKKMYAQLKPGGILVTYCAKGVVKRTLKAVGFKVESIPGPPGKREMTRAHKP
ncbi:MAG: tRNA (5-methylaminomethyl-2-thiouridine)(34)-methyltransferase MnmD [Chitinophagales bacterium]